MNHKVIFFEIKKASQKLDKIIGAAHYHFKSNHKLLILTPNDKATLFIEELLWKEPKQSFLPHNVDENDIILITHDRAVLQKPIHYIFNLTEYALDLSSPSRTVYEFDDLINDEKKKTAKEKFQFYHRKKYQIQSS